jgi:hypothetical protein
VIAAPQEKVAEPPQWSLSSQVSQLEPFPSLDPSQSRLGLVSAVGEHLRDEPSWTWIIEMMDFLDGWHPDAGVVFEIDMQPGGSGLLRSDAKKTWVHPVVNPPSSQFP